MPISDSESSVTISGFHLHPYHLFGLFTSSCMLHGTFSTLDFTHRHGHRCTLLHPSLLRPSIIPRSLHMGFVVNKVAVWDRHFSNHFGFQLPAPVYQCSTLIFHSSTNDSIVLVNGGIIKQHHSNDFLQLPT